MRLIQLTSTFAILLLLDGSDRVLSKKERGLDVSSILSFFSDTEDVVGSTQPPDTTQRKSRAQSKKSNGGHRCKCEERAARRLRREIKDISFTQCEHPGIALDDEKAIELRNVTITPNPLIAPGDVFIYFQLEVYKPLPRHIQVDVDVYKLMFDTLPVKVPCMTVRNTDGDLSLGSCSYKNLCSYIGSSACTTFSTNDLPCACEDIPPAVYNLQTPIPVIIPGINGIFDILVKGSYKTRIAFTDSRTKREIGCISATFKITKVHKDKDPQRALFFKQRKSRR